MSELISTGTALSLLRPGIRDMWGLGYNRYPSVYSQIFQQLNSDLAFERDVNLFGLGMPHVRPEGTATKTDRMGEGYVYDYIPVTYSNGVVITQQAIRRNQYMSMAKTALTELGDSFRDAKETVHANLFNQATNTAYAYADGQPMLSATHALAGGGQFSNTLAIDNDLSEAAVEQMYQKVWAMTDDRGRKRRIEPTAIVVSPADAFDAERIFGSEYAVGTANNDINPMYKKLKVIVWQYLNPGAWFFITDAPNGLKTFNVDPFETSEDIEFATDNIRIKAIESYSLGITDIAAVFGVPAP